MRVHFIVLATTAAALAALMFASTPGADAGAPAHASNAPKPQIRRWLIPFGPQRKRETAAYSERHYGEPTWRLRHPRVIVEHMAETSTPGAVFNTFAPDRPDPELGELPNVCSHFVVSSSGHVFRLVNLRTRCRHTVGLNWTAIGIEHTGFADADALGDRRQMHASLRLTQYLRCRFHISVHDVIGHAESLTSRFHRERVRSLRTQTHGDWRHGSMRVYRQRLRQLGPCRSPHRYQQTGSFQHE